MQGPPLQRPRRPRGEGAKGRRGGDLGRLSAPLCGPVGCFSSSMSFWGEGFPVLSSKSNQEKYVFFPDAFPQRDLPSNWSNSVRNYGLQRSKSNSVAQWLASIFCFNLFFGEGFPFCPLNSSKETKGAFFFCARKSTMHLSPAFLVRPILRSGNSHPIHRTCWA